MQRLLRDPKSYAITQSVEYLCHVVIIKISYVHLLVRYSHVKNGVQLFLIVVMSVVKRVHGVELQQVTLIVEARVARR